MDGKDVSSNLFQIANPVLHINIVISHKSKQLFPVLVSLVHLHKQYDACRFACRYKLTAKFKVEGEPVGAECCINNMERGVGVFIIFIGIIHHSAKNN